MIGVFSIHIHEFDDCKKVIRLTHLNHICKYAGAIPDCIAILGIVWVLVRSLGLEVTKVIEKSYHSHS
jgi:hypothetical protein